MSQSMKLLHGTASAWTSTNPILALGECGIESDTGKFKFGNGSTSWVSLAYIWGDTGVSEDWTFANPTLGYSEIGLEIDTGKFKYGDGTTEWKDLAYAGEVPFKARMRVDAHTSEWQQFVVVGGAFEIDWSLGDRWYGTLESGENIPTYTNLPDTGISQTLTFCITQPASGAAGTVTWPSGSTYPGGTPLDLSTAHGDLDLVVVLFDPTGTLFVTSLVGTGYASS